MNPTSATTTTTTTPEFQFLMTVQQLAAVVIQNSDAVKDAVVLESARTMLQEALDCIIATQNRRYGVVSRPQHAQSLTSLSEEDLAALKRSEPHQPQSMSSSTNSLISGGGDSASPASASAAAPSHPPIFAALLQQHDASSASLSSRQRRSNSSQSNLSKHSSMDSTPYFTSVPAEVLSEECEASPAAAKEVVTHRSPSSPPTAQPFGVPQRGLTGVIPPNTLTNAPFPSSSSTKSPSVSSAPPGTIVHPQTTSLPVANYTIVTGAAASAQLSQSPMATLIIPAAMSPLIPVLSPPRSPPPPPTSNNPNPPHDVNTQFDTTLNPTTAGAPSFTSLFLRAMALSNAADGGHQRPPRALFEDGSLASSGRSSPYASQTGSLGITPPLSPKRDPTASSSSSTFPDSHAQAAAPIIPKMTSSAPRPIIPNPTSPPLTGHTPSKQPQQTQSPSSPSAVPTSPPGVVVAHPTRSNPRVITDAILQILRTAMASNPQAADTPPTDASLGWLVLKSIWNLAPSNFDDSVLDILHRQKTPRQAEEILFAIGAVDLRHVRNISAFAITMIKEHETMSQVCMRFLAGICHNDQPDHQAQCPFVHPENTIGWEVLKQRWNVTYRDIDYAALSYLCKQPVEARDKILFTFADMHLKNVKNHSAYLNRAVRMHQGSGGGGSGER